MSNSISFVGRLGSDAELKNVGENTVLEFNVANNVGFGEKQITNWFRCAYWGRQGQSIERFMNKGKQVFVTGELSLRNYTNREGVERTSCDVRVANVTFVGGRDEMGDAPSRPAPAQESAPAAPASAADGGSEEEDLPF